MAVFDVLVSTDDLVVLGPPNNIDLNISVGNQGPRGATFYIGQGNPNDAAVSNNFLGQNISPAAGDLFINTASGAKYGWLYIYNPKISGNQWDEALKIQPSYYSLQSSAIFTSGTAQVSIPLSNFTLPAVYNENNFIVTLSANDSVPITASLSSKTISGSNLLLEIKGIEYASSTWSQLNRSVVMSLNVALVF